MNQCPVCGYIEKPNISYQRESQSMFSQRKRSTQKIIKHAYSKIVKHVPSDKSIKAIWKFLQKIYKVEDSVVNRTIDRYMNDRMYLRQLGLAYLGAMILNTGQNKRAAIISEKQRYGSKPPTIKLEGDSNGQSSNSGRSSRK